MLQQRTITNPIKAMGVGLHSGKKVILELLPAPADSGINFIRSDLEPNVEIPAIFEHVGDTTLSTTLYKEGSRISTIEHLLSAIAGLGVDNCIIKVNGPEIPIMDGSAKDFVECLIKAGIKVQNQERRVLEITKAVNYTNPYRDIDIHVIPSDSFRITFMVDYPLPALGTQYEAIYNMEEDFAVEVAPARTFCLLSEVTELAKQGLIKGGNVGNAVIIVDTDIDGDEVNLFKEIF